MGACHKTRTRECGNRIRGTDWGGGGNRKEGGVGINRIHRRLEWTCRRTNQRWGMQPWIHKVGPPLGEVVSLSVPGGLVWEVCLVPEGDVVRCSPSSPR